MSVNIKFKAFEELTKMATQLGRVVLRKRQFLAVNTVVSVGCCTCAELIEQKIIERRKHLGRRRMFSMASCGFLSGFTSTFWYLWSATFTGRYKILKQLLFYQTVFTPYEYMQFYITVGLLEGESLQDVVAEIKKKFPITYLADWILSPPLMFINFKLIPLKFRVIYDNSISLVWCVFLSFMKHHELDLNIQHYKSHLESMFLESRS
eukprot:gene5688-6389_t